MNEVWPCLIDPISFQQMGPFEMVSQQCLVSLDHVGWSLISFKLPCKISTVFILFCVMLELVEWSTQHLCELSRRTNAPSQQFISSVFFPDFLMGKNVSRARSQRSSTNLLKSLKSDCWIKFSYHFGRSHGSQFVRCWCYKAWFPYNHPDRPNRPDRLKMCSGDRDDHMEMLWNN